MTHRRGLKLTLILKKDDEAQSDSFETIEPKHDNPVQREFEIGKLGREELKEDELKRDASPHGAPRNTKPSHEPIVYCWIPA